MRTWVSFQLVLMKAITVPQSAPKFDAYRVLDHKKNEEPAKRVDVFFDLMGNRTGKVLGKREFPRGGKQRPKGALETEGFLSRLRRS